MYALRKEELPTNRQEAVFLLKEIMAVCESFQFAQAVSIEHGKGSDGWELRVSWVPHPSETRCLEKIAANHRVEVVNVNGRSVFRSIKSDN